MTPLRQRMIEDLHLRGYAERTVESYVGAVAQLAQHYHTPPDRVSEEQLRAYFLYLSTGRKLARASVTVALSAIKCFYRQTLGRSWSVLDIVRPRRDKKLSVVLGREEVWRILDAVRTPAYRVCLTTMYACGLRLLEGARLEVSHIDGARNLLHVRHGKGGKDRLVPLQDVTLVLLREHWRTHRHPSWVFPVSSRGAQRRDPASAPGPVGPTSLQKGVRACRARQWRAEARACAYPAPQLCDASPGSGRAAAPHPGVSRAYGSAHDHALHASDARAPGGRAGSDQWPDAARLTAPGKDAASRSRRHAGAGGDRPRGGARLLCGPCVAPAAVAAARPAGYCPVSYAVARRLRVPVRGLRRPGVRLPLLPRHCPKCQEDRAHAWLARLRARLLPCDHYLLTFTRPHELHPVARAHQRVVYAALLREAAAALQVLAADPAWVGGTPGILAVLHTWSRTLEYHPHAHLLVTAGGLAHGGRAWRTPGHRRFLVPGYALSEIFRAKMRDAVARSGVAGDIDPRVWRRRWTVHVQQIGTGDHAALYLARYVYRVALTNARLERFQHGRVTFRYQHARTHTLRRATLPTDVFLTRFLQHVLPRGFTKIRSYGLLSPGRRRDLEHARGVLETRAPAAAPSTTTPGAATSPDTPRGVATGTDSNHTATGIEAPARRCPVCHRGQLRYLARYPSTRAPPG